MDEGTEQQPRIPGVRYRKVERTRMVPTTINGETRMTPQSYAAWEPVPPRNLDALYLRAVIGVAVVMTAVAVVWSTAAIGGLLALVVHPLIGYGAATVFESVWVVCMIVEWLERYDRKRARVARIAGWFALGVVVLAVTAHGVHVGQEVAGVVGGAVSVMAKCTWVVVLRMFAVPLGQSAGAFLQQKREELTVARVVLGEQQRLDGVAAYLTAVYGPDAPKGVAQALPAGPDVPETVSRQATAAPTPPVSGQPSGTVSEQVTPPPAPPVPPVPPDVRKISVPGIAAICRTEIGADPAVTDAALHAAVLAAGHPDRPNLADTVRRTAQRIDPTRRKTP